MDQRDLPLFLHRLRFLSQLPERTVRQLALCAELRSLAPGEVLFREGATDENLYVVSRGRIAVEMDVPNHGPVRILTVGAGDVLGWSALLGGGRMTATATALDDSQVVAFPADRLTELCQADGEVGYQFMRQMALALSRRLVETRRQLLDLAAETASPR